MNATKTRMMAIHSLISGIVLKHIRHCLYQFAKIGT